jgi:hypothetical protein
MTTYPDFSFFPSPVGVRGAVAFATGDVVISGVVKTNGLYTSTGNAWKFIGACCTPTDINNARPDVLLTAQSFKAYMDAHPAGSSFPSFVIGESPIGTINGINNIFTSQNPFVPETVELFLNGIVQFKPAHYQTVGNNTLLISDSPLVTDTLLLNYIKL